MIQCVAVSEGCKPGNKSFYRLYWNFSESLERNGLLPGFQRFEKPPRCFTDYIKNSNILPLTVFLRCLPVKRRNSTLFRPVGVYMISVSGHEFGA